MDLTDFWLFLVRAAHRSPNHHPTMLEHTSKLRLADEGSRNLSYMWLKASLSVWNQNHWHSWLSRQPLVSQSIHDWNLDELWLFFQISVPFFLLFLYLIFYDCFLIPINQFVRWCFSWSLATNISLRAIFVVLFSLIGTFLLISTSCFLQFLPE